ncbi:hypothetical protein WJX84_000401 [Apatococcus fuscideae]|uniref:Uncharacterized protein n=1 Tax=Apatococcus fuscideae TaxID=2026836 RepID=A0AAW1T5B0_9CHLO
MLSAIRRQCSRECFNSQHDGWKLLRSPQLRLNSDSTDQESHDTHKASDTGDFIKNAIKAPIEEVKKMGEKVFGDRKQMSSQDMGPAGHMQGRDPNKNKADQYEGLNEKKDKKWEGQSPTGHWKEDPEAPAVGSDPRSEQAADAAKKDH